MVLALPWPSRGRWLAPGATLFALTIDGLPEATSEPSESSPSPAATEMPPQEQIDRFESLFHDFEQPIFAYLWRMIGDEQAAHDLLQETFVRAWKQFTKISTYEQPGAWLYRVATNLALNHLRDRAVPVMATVPIDEGDALNERDIGSLLAMRDLVKQTLLGMPPRQRAALVLREVHGLSCEEVGKALGCSRDAAKVLLFRAREQFRADYSWRSNGGPDPRTVGKEGKE